MIRNRELQFRFGMVSLAGGLALAFAFLAFPQGARAQQEVEVTLGSDLSVPGGDAFLPLTITAKGVKAGKVTSEISFPKNVLSFVGAKREEAGNQVEAEIKTEVKDSNGSTAPSILRVTISAGKELPEGLLATLKFQVAKSAPETDVRLKNVVKVVSLGGEEIQGAKGNEAILTISPAKLPSVGCFFFTH